MKSIKKKNKTKKSHLNENKDKEIILMNNNLRTKIISLLSEIEQIINGNTEIIISEDNLINVLDDLPEEQQISIYKDSINSLKNNISKYEKEIFAIYSIENSIRAKREILYNTNIQREYLNKINLNNKKVLNKIENDDIRKIHEELIEEIKKAKNEYQDIKKEYNKSFDNIKEQNKAIYILEDNCKFIKENIDYKKGNLETISERLNDLEVKLEEIEIKKKVEEDCYLNEIKQQNKHIEELEIENEFLERTINNILKERKKKEIQEKLKKYKIQQKKWESLQNMKTNNFTQNINNTFENDINNHFQKNKNENIPNHQSTLEYFYKKIDESENLN